MGKDRENRGKYKMEDDSKGNIAFCLCVNDVNFY